jgi:hypothetical protein
VTQWRSDCYTFSQRVGKHGNCVHHAVSWCSCDEWSEHSLSMSETQTATSSHSDLAPCTPCPFRILAPWCSLTDRLQCDSTRWHAFLK